MNQQLRNMLLWALIFVVIAVSIGLLRKASLKETDLAFSKFDQLVEQGQVKTAVIKGTTIKGELKDPIEGASNYSTSLPPDLQNYTPKLVGKGIDVRSSDSSSSQYLFAFFYIAPVIALIAFWFFFMRQMQQGGNKAFSFGKSKAKLVNESKNKITFKDVAGIEEVKEELYEIIDFLKDPQKFQKLGGKIPKGVLLMGAPGTGKTLLAKAIAGEAGVPFFSISGSEFVELFVGVGASRVRDMFEQAKKNAPCIVFIDEIDAVGRNRGVGNMGGHEEREHRDVERQRLPGGAEEKRQRDDEAAERTHPEGEERPRLLLAREGARVSRLLPKRCGEAEPHAYLTPGPLRGAETISGGSRPEPPPQPGGVRITRLRISVMSSIAKRTPSRPRPESFTPP